MLEGSGCVIEDRLWLEGGLGLETKWIEQQENGLTRSI